MNKNVLVIEDLKKFATEILGIAAADDVRLIHEYLETALPGNLLAEFTVNSETCMDVYIKLIDKVVHGDQPVHVLILEEK